MVNLKYSIVGLVSILFLGSCDPADHVVQFIQNETSSDLKSVFYRGGKEIKEYSIPAGSKIKIHEEEDLSATPIDWNLYDSVVFVSPNKEKLKYVPGVVNVKSIYNYDYWQGGLDNDKKYKGDWYEYVFLLQEEDLKNPETGE